MAEQEPTSQLESLVAEANNIPTPVRIAMYVHLANVFWCVVVLLLGALPYYYYLGVAVTLSGAAVSGLLFTAIYILWSMALANQRIDTAIMCAVPWTLSTAALVGFASATVYNISPLQFVAISLGQSIAMCIYLQSSENKTEKGLNWQWSVAALLVATLLVWLASIYGFVVEGDWLYAIGLWGAALLLCAHNVWHLRFRAETYRMEEDGIKTAIMEYYCGYGVACIKRLQG